VKDPREVVKAGQIVKVKVVDVDLKRKRIGLTMKLQEPVPAGQRPQGAESRDRGPRPPQRPQGNRAPEPRPAAPAPSSTSMAAAFAKLKN